MWGPTVPGPRSNSLGAADTEFHRRCARKVMRGAAEQHRRPRGPAGAAGCAAADLNLRRIEHIKLPLRGTPHYFAGATPMKLHVRRAERVAPDRGPGTPTSFQVRSLQGDAYEPPPGSSSNKLEVSTVSCTDN